MRKIFQPAVFQGISGYFQGHLIFGTTKFGRFCVASQIATLNFGDYKCFWIKGLIYWLAGGDRATKHVFRSWKAVSDPVILG